MKQSVWIKIKGIQSADGDRDTTELYTQGTFYEKNGVYYIAYEESETTGFAGCRTILKVKGAEKVSMIRSGPSQSNLVIQTGQRNVGYYATPEGELMIGITAKAIECGLTDQGGHLFFEYALDINASHISDNQIYVTVTPCGEQE
ncbi:MAG: DUF1934 domain-containing protein [Massiliimalia sp.]